MYASRSSLSVATSVWRALFLREALTRLSAGRGAWVWILLEPIGHVVLLMILFGVVYQRIVSGVDGAMFIMTGIMAYQVIKNTASRCTEAVGSNTALYAYRQVKPVDAVLVRAFLEGMLAMTSALLILCGAQFLGYAAMPQNIFLVLAAFGCMWSFGLGLGLIFSVAAELVSELRKFIGMLWMPVYFLSAVMYPSMAIPQPYREWLLLNPLVHGVETMRVGFYAQYAVPADLSLGYLALCAIISLALGLALQLRFAIRLAAQ